MGGYGSGRHWLSRKTTVEECLTLDINKLVKDGLFHKSFGEVRWYRGREETASISYMLRDIGFKEGRSAYVLTIHSHIILRDQRIPITENIPLVTTKLCSGGTRYWFSCLDCRERVGRLHLPHGANRFRCRRCLDLTYMSCQDSHKFDRYFARIGVPPSAMRRLFKKARRACSKPKVPC